MTCSVQDFEKVASRLAESKVSISVDEQLRLYGWYKRATVGRLIPPFEDDTERPTSRPGVFQMAARRKYDAWMEATETCATKEEARDWYVQVGGRILEQEA